MKKIFFQLLHQVIGLEEEVQNLFTKYKKLLELKSQNGTELHVK